MGLAGGLVKRVFSKGHKASPSGGRDSNDRNTVDKNRWILSKLNFCGDDFDSVHVEVNDLASLVSSEATLAKPGLAVSEETGAFTTFEISSHEEEVAVIDACSKDKGDETATEAHSVEQICREEHAATVIQSAFRGLLARREIELKQPGINAEIESFESASLSTSVEVQPGDSVKNFALKEENINIPPRVPQKTRTQAQPSRLKQEWDDSTVSSNISKLRIQNRLEAMTRRERALAYAFSQQLRACSAKKKHAQNDSTDQSMGWNWLERWMATRFPEGSFVDDCSTRHPEPSYRPMVVKKRLELALAEKESCGSNDVSVNLDSAEHGETIKHGSSATKNRLKAPSRASRRKSTSNCHYVTPTGKVAKVVSLREAEKEKQNKQMQAKATDEIRCSNASKEDELLDVKFRCSNASKEDELLAVNNSSN